MKSGFRCAHLSEPETKAPDESSSTTMDVDRDTGTTMVVEPTQEEVKTPPWPPTVEPPRPDVVMMEISEDVRTTSEIVREERDRATAMATSEAATMVAPTAPSPGETIRITVRSPADPSTMVEIRAQEPRPKSPPRILPICDLGPSPKGAAPPAPSGRKAPAEKEKRDPSRPMQPLRAAGQEQALVTESPKEDVKIPLEEDVICHILATREMLKSRKGDLGTEKGKGPMTFAAIYRDLWPLYRSGKDTRVWAQMWQAPVLFEIMTNRRICFT